MKLSILNLILNLAHCPLCHQASSSLNGCCDSCLQDLFEPKAEAELISLGYYRGNLERAIRAFKYAQVTKLAPLFATHLAKVIQAENWQLDVICAVPLHSNRYLKRGYNQSSLLAKALAFKLALVYKPLLSRGRSTSPQTHLHRKDRLSNVCDAFLAKPLRGERVLLIDDVTTSGATLQECAKTLLEAGASTVKCAVVAKTLVK